MAGNQSSSKSIAFRCSTLHMLNMLASSLAPDDVGLGYCGVLGPCGRPLEMYSGKDSWLGCKKTFKRMFV